MENLVLTLVELGGNLYLDLVRSDMVAVVVANITQLVIMVDLWWWWIWFWNKTTRWFWISVQLHLRGNPGGNSPGAAAPGYCGGGGGGAGGVGRPGDLEMGIQIMGG